MKVRFGDLVEKNGERTCSVTIDDVPIADLVGSAHTLYDGDKSIRRGLRGQAYHVVIYADAPQSIRTLLSPAMPDDGRSFFTVTMAKNAIRDLVNNRSMRLPEGWAPPRAGWNTEESPRSIDMAAATTDSSEVVVHSAVVTREEILEKLQRLESTDLVGEERSRREQEALRQWLFAGKDTERCALCGEEFSTASLVAAHKKKRSECTDSERRNPYIVAPLCKFGCDFLYEERYVRVENGIIQRGEAFERQTVESEYIEDLIGARVDAKWLQGPRLDTWN